MNGSIEKRRRDDLAASFVSDLQGIVRFREETFERPRRQIGVAIVAEKIKVRSRSSTHRNVDVPVAIDVTGREGPSVR